MAGAAANSCHRRAVVAPPSRVVVQCCVPFVRSAVLKAPTNACPNVVRTLSEWLRTQSERCPTDVRPTFQLNRTMSDRCPTDDRMGVSEGEKSWNHRAIDEGLPNPGDVIHGHNKENSYTVIRELGKGSFGAVYEAERMNDEANSRTGSGATRRYAVKCELLKGKARQLKMELAILRQFKDGGRHFCQVYDRSQTNTYKFIVMTLVGHNLFDLRKVLPDFHFTLSTALRLALQTLEAIEDFHNIGYVHRDIKPGNFAIGTATSKAEQRKVYVLDFGLARKYKHDNGELRRCRNKAGFRGTVRYASLQSHRGEDLSRKDDLESWTYMSIELTVGVLPWRSMKDRLEVKAQKEAVRKDMTELLRPPAPKNYGRILTYVDQIDFWTKPDYNFIRTLLRRDIERAGANESDPYDWEEGGSHHDTTSLLPPPRVHSDRNEPQQGSDKKDDNEDQKDTPT